MSTNPFVTKVALIMLSFSLCWPGITFSQRVSDAGFDDFGFSEMFTPQETLNFSSITLTVTGYTDYTYQNPPQDSTLELDISDNDGNYLYPIPYPLPFASGYSTINSGTGVNYCFDLAGSLCANTDYWLTLWLTGPDGVYAIYAYWDAAVFQSTAAQNIILDGSESVNGTPLPYSSATPVSITAIPEPSTMSFYSLVLLSLIVPMKRLINRCSKHRQPASFTPLG
jgi:hypothetical protein